MEQRSTINQITPATPDWTCKVQVVDKGRERESGEKKKTKFQNLILQDEEEQQIKGIVFGEDIGYYKEKLHLFKTYLVSVAKVKESSTIYGPPLHKFYWVFDKETIVDPVSAGDEGEAPLPPPTKLNLTSFGEIAHLGPNSAGPFDMIGVVVRCDPSKFVGRYSNECKEITVVDNQNNQFVMTLWEDFARVEGAKLMLIMEKEKRYPVIVARNIVTSQYKGFTLQTKFSTTIQIEPPYPQASELVNWAKNNYDMLTSYSSRGAAVASGSRMVILSNQQIIPTAEIQSETTTQVFHVEAEISLPNDSQYFFVLECSDCKQSKRSRGKKTIHCTFCDRETLLVPRCSFQILTDGSGSTTATISGELGEKLLSLTAGEIRETTAVKMELLPLKHIQDQLSGRLFRVQLKKSVWKNSENMLSKLSVLSYSEKEQTISTPTSEGNKKKKSSIIDEEEMEYRVAKAECSSKMLKLEPATPSKKV